MAYLNLDLDYFDHPKVVRLVGQLGRGADLLPVRLWCYCGKYHAETGELIGYSPLEIETAIKWWGQAGRAVEAMVGMAFLDQIPGGFKVHDWASINGHISSLKKRAQDGAAERWRLYRERKAVSDAQAMLKHSPSIASANALTSSLKKEEEEKKRRIKTVLSHVEPGNLPPAKRDPDNLEATKKLIKPKKPRTEIADDWQIPPEILEWCAAQKLPEPEYQLPRFINYFQSKGEARADWSATFRNWMLSPYRKDRINGSQNGGGGGNPRGYETSSQRQLRKLKANLGLDQPAGDGAAPTDIVLPLLSPGTAGAGNA